MSLVNPKDMLKDALNKGYAIPAFNVHNLETLQAVVEGAYEERSPVMVQTTPGTLRHAGMSYMVAATRAASKLYDIPIALHLDHCQSFETIIECMREGYTSVMIDSSKLPYDENVAEVKRVVEIAKILDIAVEAELGRIGGVEDDVFVDERDAAFTVPSEAKSFVEETGVDSLAIAIGTAHGLYKGEPKLDFERLTAIREILSLPLVLHGGSGIPDDSIKEAIRRGISKINIATELKIPMAFAIQDVFKDNPSEDDPRAYMGAAKLAVKEVVRKKIRLCGSNSRA